MSLDPKFVLMPALQQVIFDKTLDTFLSGGEVSFFQDENRTVPKDVYTLVGTGPGSYSYVSLGSVLTLSGIGSFVDSSGGNIIPYLYPYEGLPTDLEPSDTVELYYITVYSSTGVFQFDISAWPNLTANASPINSSDTTDNVLANPEFSEILFPASATSGSPFVFTTTGTNTVTEIAPDWSVITTGSGTFSVYQQTITDDTAPGNPAYALGITSASYSNPIQLRQRLYNPRLFSGSYVSGTLIVEATDGGSHLITMNYTPSITGTIQQICSGTTSNSGFTLIYNNPPTLISDPGSGTGYVDITIVIPVGASVQISCVQLCAVADGTEIVSYLQQPPSREADHLFHYWQEPLNFKPIPSYLIGWDFPLNPAQFFGSTLSPSASGANTSYYAWDQTIIFQSANNAINISRVANLGYLQLSAAVNTQMAVVQYLTGPQMQDLLVQAVNGLSVNVRMSSTTLQTVCVSLWWTANASLPDMSSSTSFIAGLDVNGHPNSVVAGWNEIRIPYGDGLFTSKGSLAIDDYSLSGFINSSAFQTATFFAIAVGTSQVLSGNVVNFGSISLVPGLIATIPSPQTVDQVLRECQYYYEISYSSFSDFTTNPANNILFIPQASENFTTAITECYASPFSVPFKVIKRTNPNMTYYSVAKTAANVSAIMYYDSGSVFTTLGPTDRAVATYWNTTVKTNNFYFTPKVLTALQAVNSIGIGKYNSAGIQLHYVADARLGIV